MHYWGDLDPPDKRLSFCGLLHDDSPIVDMLPPEPEPEPEVPKEPHTPHWDPVPETEEEHPHWDPIPETDEDQESVFSFETTRTLGGPVRSASVNYYKSARYSQIVEPLRLKHMSTPPGCMYYSPDDFSQTEESLMDSQYDESDDFYDSLIDEVNAYDHGE